MNALVLWCVLLLSTRAIDGFVAITNRMPRALIRNRPLVTKLFSAPKVAKGKSQTVQLDAPNSHIDYSVDISKDRRLYPDSQDLVDWVQKFGGDFKADIAKVEDSWSLAARSNAPANTPLIRIPKMLCIFSDSNWSGSPLLEGTTLLMNSLHRSQWRARLAIALLSERSRPESFFFPYLRNLPVDYNVPLFYTEDELV